MVCEEIGLVVGERWWSSVVWGLTDCVVERWLMVRMVVDRRYRF